MKVNETHTRGTCVSFMDSCTKMCRSSLCLYDNVGCTLSVENYKVENIEQKRRKKEKSHGHRRQCGDCPEAGASEGGGGRGGYGDGMRLDLGL